ncbi:hypothetical protein QR680_013928 [Steinernema hermaphroditum]|uniref:Uncharacterized protein n=1 Tax=Steinernema hermaphroditum TaxID=289476 RepID=A0AA39M372_9BILA|nr:hypothetical protein QR680_013928 [Steinernema hermaphroditum]
MTTRTLEALICLVLFSYSCASFNTTLFAAHGLLESDSSDRKVDTSVAAFEEYLDIVEDLATLAVDSGFPPLQLLGAPVKLALSFRDKENEKFKKVMERLSRAFARLEEGVYDLENAVMCKLDDVQFREIRAIAFMYSEYQSYFNNQGGNSIADRMLSDRCDCVMEGTKWFYPLRELIVGSFTDSCMANTKYEFEPFFSNFFDLKWIALTIGSFEYICYNITEQYAHVPPLQEAYEEVGLKIKDIFDTYYKNIVEKGIRPVIQAMISEGIDDLILASKSPYVKELAVLQKHINETLLRYQNAHERYGVFLHCPIFNSKDYVWNQSISSTFTDSVFGTVHRYSPKRAMNNMAKFAEIRQSIIEKMNNTNPATDSAEDLVSFIRDLHEFPLVAAVVYLRPKASQRRFLVGGDLQELSTTREIQEIDRWQQMPLFLYKTYDIHVVIGY